MWALRLTLWRTVVRPLAVVRRWASLGPPKSEGPLILRSCRTRDTHLELRFGAIPKLVASASSVGRVQCRDTSCIVEEESEEENEEEGEEVARVDFVWLRDHCRAVGTSMREDTGQRMVDTASIPLDLRPREARVQRGMLTVTWPDEHVSEYEGSWLLTNSRGERQRCSQTEPHRELWDSLTLQKLAHHDPAVLQGEPCYEELLHSDAALRRVLQRLLALGFAMVGGVPATVEATRTLAERFAFIRETLFGRMWEFGADGERSDSAYTNEQLDRHTDTPYLYEPARVQVFHVLAGATRGGHTLLVDGFRAAERLRRCHPEAFEELARVAVTHEYSEEGGRGPRHLLRAARTVVGTERGEVVMVCYNNYDRVALAVSGHEQARRWYLAHRLLTALLRQPRAEAWFQLQPGMVLLVDNWRVLHGREAFTGPRRVCGCYLPHDDLLDTARRLGLVA